MESKTPPLLEPENQMGNEVDSHNYNPNVDHKLFDGNNIKENKRGRPKAASIRKLMSDGENSQSNIKCNYCARVFPREKSLQAHLRIHTGERPYMCDYPECTRAFTQSGQLKTHFRLHTGEKPFVCSFEGCQNKFTHANRRCPNHPEALLKRCDNSDDTAVKLALLNPVHSEAVQNWLEKYKRDQDINKRKMKREKAENTSESENDSSVKRKRKQCRNREQLKTMNVIDNNEKSGNSFDELDSKSEHRVNDLKLELPKKRWLREASQDQYLKDLNQSRPTVLMLAKKDNNTSFISPQIVNNEDFKHENKNSLTYRYDLSPSKNNIPNMENICRANASDLNCNDSNHENSPPDDSYHVPDDYHLMDYDCVANNYSHFNNSNVMSRLSLSSLLPKMRQKSYCSSYRNDPMNTLNNSQATNVHFAPPENSPEIKSDELISFLDNYNNDSFDERLVQKLSDESFDLNLSYDTIDNGIESYNESFHGRTSNQSSEGSSHAGFVPFGQVFNSDDQTVSNKQTEIISDLRTDLTAETPDLQVLHSDDEINDQQVKDVYNTPSSFLNQIQPTTPSKWQIPTTLCSTPLYDISTSYKKSVRYKNFENKLDNSLDEELAFPLPGTLNFKSSEYLQL